jgi:hypothetical protein
MFVSHTKYSKTSFILSRVFETVYPHCSFRFLSFTDGAIQCNGFLPLSKFGSEKFIDVLLKDNFFALLEKIMISTPPAHESLPAQKTPNEGGGGGGDMYNRAGRKNNSFSSSLPSHSLPTSSLPNTTFINAKITPSKPVRALLERKKTLPSPASTSNDSTEHTANDNSDNESLDYATFAPLRLNARTTAKINIPLQNRPAQTTEKINFPFRIDLAMVKPL